ncbi:MAG TPA: tRNA preQ1(34) S-adenosylmethionine ribosyltransferase-isomerase QueA [Vicinamibacterales bacterium]|nr:tRNA preQ1(34) S-adenosylmethionine ribosyltransferase-isomerase QueA [Vicinamibacterales bacterium]
MKVADFDFALPDELIAQEASPRGGSRLLVLDRTTGGISHASIRDLPRCLRRGDLLVINDTRVFPARLLGHRVPSGGAVECLLLQKEDVSDIRSPESGTQIWSALVHPGQKLKSGALVRFAGAGGVLMAEVLERQFFGRRRIRLWADGGDIDEIVDAIGHVPLPPYIHRDDRAADRERYQTVFAERRGSVAAPTAGLHFDRALFGALERAGVEHVSLTLHVGYGTFKPVRVDDVDAHVVDPEPYEIAERAAVVINAALDAGRRIVAVGTTTTRALEDAAIRGSGRIVPGRANATVFIRPGHQFRVLSGLLTNFHLPKSSLLMLAAAFAGRERLLEAYRVAIAARYRFYSYGDAMLIA